MSLRAYQQAAARSESPRETEYRIFGQVTRALIEASSSTDAAARIDALDWNRRLWSTLAADCAEPANELPQEVRAQIISLSMWVGRHTAAVVRREEDFAALIDLNRTMMQALSSRVAAA
ncbi:MAG TPA: flagellar biosynthesis regulator FlaF [Caulobacteraceae bacterium]|nr:flagellar biosynthesis regulator FlaF [Caulobacteraceae bacterium]